MRRAIEQIRSVSAAMVCFAATLTMIGAWAPSSALAEEGGAASDALPALSRVEAREIQVRVAELRRQARALKKSGDHDQALTLDEVLREVPRPHSPGNIYRWVRDTIAFEPYAGSLRGVQGTLIARSGNAVDQALLTRELLRRAGHTTRFASGRLHDSDAAEVLRALTGQAQLESAADLPKPDAVTPDPAMIARLR